MKRTLSILILGFIFSTCNQSNNSHQLQAQIDSLKHKPDNSYKPGLGEFMSGIQVHHAKLWFAGQNQNWELADFEINEIKEALEDVQKYCTDRPELKFIGMINEPIDSVSNAIRQKSILQFKSNYILLTNTCNNCHRETAHEFNKIIIPTSPPLTNQKF